MLDNDAIDWDREFDEAMARLAKARRHLLFARARLCCLVLGLILAFYFGASGLNS